MTRPIVHLQNIHKIYGAGETEVRALNGVDFTVQPGEFIAVMGPSGSGKSTCMNIVGCLDVPTHGSYQFLGVEVGELSREELAILRRTYLGFVFQSFNLIARTGALRNVELPLIYKGVGRRQRRQRAADALASVGLADRMDHAPSELSGGQQQRVALARALLQRTADGAPPAVLVLDDSLSAVDTATEASILACLRARQGRQTTVIVAHRLSTVVSADHIYVLHEGRIVQQGDHASLLAQPGPYADLWQSQAEPLDALPLEAS